MSLKTIKNSYSSGLVLDKIKNVCIMKDVFENGIEKKIRFEKLLAE